MENALSTEEILGKMRCGYSMIHALKYGDFEFRIRLLKNDEEIRLIEDAKKETLKANPEATEDMIKAASMKSILHHAGQSGGVSQLTFDLLNSLTSTELQALYGKYLEVLDQVDPEFMEMDYDLVKVIVEDVRKKKLNPRQVSTKQLAMIGVFFLESVLPEAIEAGS